MKISKKNRGFTLIEVLVAVSIVSILLSVISISVSGSRKDARNATRQTDIKQIGTALELYYTDEERYITSDRNLCKGDSIGKFIESVSEDPLSGDTNQICYTWVDNTASICKNKFCVYATLEGIGVGYFAASHKGVTMLVDEPGTTVVPPCECW